MSSSAPRGYTRRRKDPRTFRQILWAGPRDVTVRPTRTETRPLTAAGSDLGLKSRAPAAGLRPHSVAGWSPNRALSAKLASKLRLSRADNSGMSAQHIDCNGRSWTMCLLLRICERARSDGKTRGLMCTPGEAKLGARVGRPALRGQATDLLSSRSACAMIGSLSPGDLARRDDYGRHRGGRGNPAGTDH